MCVFIHEAKASRGNTQSYLEVISDLFCVCLLCWEPWPSCVNGFAFHLFLKAFNKRQILHTFYIVAYNYSALYKYSPSLNLSTFQRCYNLEMNRTQYSSRQDIQRKMLTRLLHRLWPCRCCETLTISSGVSSCPHKMTESVKWCHRKCNSEVT